MGLGIYVRQDHGQDATACTGDGMRDIVILRKYGLGDRWRHIDGLGRCTGFPARCDSGFDDVGIYALYEGWMVGYEVANTGSLSWVNNTNEILPQDDSFNSSANLQAQYRRFQVITRSGRVREKESSPFARVP